MCHCPRSVIFTKCCHAGDRYMTVGLRQCLQSLYSFLNLLIFIKECFSGYMIFSLFLLLCSLLPACVLKYKYTIKNGLRPGVFAQVCFAYMVFLLGIPSIIISSLSSGTIPVQERLDTHCCKHLWAESLFHWRSFSFWVLVQKIQKFVYGDFTWWRYWTGHSLFHSGFFCLLAFYRHRHRYLIFFLSLGNVHLMRNINHDLGMAALGRVYEHKGASLTVTLHYPVCVFLQCVGEGNPVWPCRWNHSALLLWWWGFRWITGIKDLSSVSSIPIWQPAFQLQNSGKGSGCGGSGSLEKSCRLCLLAEVLGSINGGRTVTRCFGIHWRWW